MINKRDKLGRIAMGNNRRHGYSKMPIYDCWVAMKARCRIKHHPLYKYYGARGISFCERWEKFDNFLADMGQKPSAKHTLDRVDNDGWYTPENCRWVTIQEQQKNRSNNNTVVGSSFDKARGKWHTTITYNGTKTFLGRFATLTEAKEARIQAEKEIWAL